LGQGILGHHHSKNAKAPKKGQRLMVPQLFPINPIIETRPFKFQGNPARIEGGLGD